MTKLPWMVLLMYLLLASVEANTPPVFVTIPNTNPMKYYNMDKEQFKENKETNSVIYTLTASDPDSDCIQFTIEDSADNDGFDYFMISHQTCTTAEIMLKEELDYETHSRHKITWMLEDGVNTGVPTEITIYVLDINDNAPEFIGLPYIVNVNEDHDVFSNMFTVSVEDKDSSMNGMGVLSIGNISAAEFNLTDNSDWTGKLMLIKELDYETITSFIITITATDSGTDPGPLSSTATLTVSVRDIDDVPPQWIGEPYSTRIYSNTKVNTTILTVSARDGDRTNPNEVEYYIAPNETLTNNISEYFEVNRFSGEVYVTYNIANIKGDFNLSVLAVESDRKQDWEIKTSTTEVALQIIPIDVIIAPPDVATIATSISLLIICVVAVFVLALCINRGDHDFKHRRVHPVLEPTKKDMSPIEENKEDTVTATTTV